MGRRLGQHFLTNPGILRRIAESACPEPVPLVIEIGPGKGALTRHLLDRAERVVAIELDSALAGRLRGLSERLEVVEGDVLATDLTAWGAVPVVGNLPYYITSPIVEKALSIGHLLRHAAFLVQKEVAERIAAKPGKRDYGYLSVSVQARANVELLFQVPPGAFSPPPKVDSAVFRMTPKEPICNGMDGFLGFVSACFAQKRKMLRNNLRSIYKDRIEERPEASLRAEQLSPEQLAALYEALGGPA